jgi:cardiolipin synthase A/B
MIGADSAGRDRGQRDDPAWAAGLAEQLPAGDLHRLAAAAAAGAGAVQTLRAQAAGGVLRDACDQLSARLVHQSGAAYLAGVLAGAASAVARERERQHIDVVWTGPEVGTGAERLTAAVIADLIGHARRELLLVSYATNNEPSIEAALAAAAERGVEITLLAERQDDNPAYTAIGTPFPGLRAVRLRWPANRRPHGAALHAKIIVVDDDIALVGSANFTGRAMASNLECGILIRGGPHPRAIRNHVEELRARGDLQRA